MWGGREEGERGRERGGGEGREQSEKWTPAFAAKQTELEKGNEISEKKWATVLAAFCLPSQSVTKCETAAGNETERRFFMRLLSPFFRLSLPPRLGRHLVPVYGSALHRRLRRRDERKGELRPEGQAGREVHPETVSILI